MMMDVSRRLRDLPIARHLMPLIYGLLAVVGFVVLMTWAALQLQITAAGFLNGESLWSKAQKQAVVDLYAYAITGRSERLAAFRRNFDVVLADRQARDAIDHSPMEASAARAAFRRGGVTPEAISGMIFTLRYFSDAPYIRDAMHAWRQADVKLNVLPLIATRLEELHTMRAPPRAELAQLGDRILTIDAQVGPLTNLFSQSIADATGLLARVLFAIVAASAVVAVLIWLNFARRILLGVRASEERYRTLFDEASDAIVLSSEHDGTIIGANRAAAMLLGQDSSDLRGQSVEQLIGPPTVTSSATLTAADGSVHYVEIRSTLVTSEDGAVRMAVIRDHSDRQRHEQERRIALEAFASMTEGVVVADADGCITAVNAAFCRLTGYASDEIIGRNLGHDRTLPGGDPLDLECNDTLQHDGSWRIQTRSRRKDGTTYPEQLTVSVIRDTDDKVLRYVAVVDDISETIAHQRRLEHLAHHDALTGLTNRTAFEQTCSKALEHAQDHNCKLAVLFIDLDGFKAINDSYGHALGDRFLVLVASRLRGMMRRGDSAGRIGGDEFTLLINDISSQDDAARVADKLLRGLAEPFIVAGHELRISASIGIALYPDHGDNAASLVTKADMAMYVAKTEERNAYRFFTPGMSGQTPSVFGVAGDLRKAIDKGEFQVVYQPCHELDTGRVIGVEALLRWHHPTRGDVEPSEFIAIAESTGVIRDIGDWVLREACTHAQQWIGHGHTELELAVNVSARTFGHPAFVESVRKVLKTTGFPAKHLVLELTESAILHIGERTHQALHELHDLGVGVAIDDFGTGYSSLSYLKLPGIRFLKIDRSFVSGLPNRSEDRAIAEAVLALAHALHLTTIAEGVETQAQRKFLVDAGCHAAQGFLFSRPMKASAITQLLDTTQPVTSG